MGLEEFPSVVSYQIDRGILENDLRQFNEDAGVVMMEGYQILEILLSDCDEPHRVTVMHRDNGQTSVVTARWLVDASGRRRFIQRQLDLGKPNGKPCSASWFRLDGRIDVADLVPDEHENWHGRVNGRNRYYSTTHIVDTGYWVWLIPLSSGTTSVGIVAQEDFHPFDKLNTFERSLQWLWEHEPSVAAYIGDRQPIDFRVMRKYSYSSKQVFSEKRWACVGEAGVFSDPYYSPGTDIIGYGNTMATELIRLDRAGQLTPEIVKEYNRFLLSVNEWLTRNIQITYTLLGHPTVSAAKLIWDIAVAWSIYGPQMFNAIYVDRNKSAEIRKVTGHFFFLTHKMQQFLLEWGARSPGAAHFDFINYLSLDFLRGLRDRNLQSGKNLDELIDDHVQNMQRLEELAQVLFLLAVEDIIPEQLPRFSSPIWLNVWGIGLDPDKWEEDGLFKPESSPRDLTEIREQIRRHFRFEITPQMREMTHA